MDHTKSPQIAVGVVVLSGEDILLVRHETGSSHVPGTYSIPAGRPKKGEALEDAAVREAFEETGLIIIRDDLVRITNEYHGMVERADGSFTLFRGIGYRCLHFSGEIRGGNDETTPGWIPRNTLPNIRLIPGLFNTIEAALATLSD